MNQQQHDIIYVPQHLQGKGGSNDSPPEGMGKIRRGLWLYSNKLGLDFTLVVGLSLGYQAVIGIFIGLNAIKRILWLEGLGASTDFPPQVISFVCSILLGLLIQGLLVAEAAQVVWLRRPDRLKVRLQSSSGWWWVMLFALIFTGIIDSVLLFLSIAGKTTIQEAWDRARIDQMNFFTFLLIVLMSALSLLRCAASQKTSTTEEIHDAIEERLKAQADEMLLNAGDETRRRTAQVWKQLSINPAELLPIPNSIINIISQRYPNMFPPDLGGNTWGYSQRGHVFASLPPDVYRALNSANTSSLGSNEAPWWKLEPSLLGNFLNSMMQRNGQPQIIDAGNPQEVVYLSRTVNRNVLAPAPASSSSAAAARQNEADFDDADDYEDDYEDDDAGFDDDFDYEDDYEDFESSRRPAPTSINRTGSVGRSGSGGSGTERRTAQNGSSVDSLSVAKILANPLERHQFAKYLAKSAYPELTGRPFSSGSGKTIFNSFTERQLALYARQWSELTPFERQEILG